VRIHTNSCEPYAPRFRGNDGVTGEMSPRKTRRGIFGVINGSSYPVFTPPGLRARLKSCVGPSDFSADATLYERGMNVVSA
jgi:hypothetical protein